VSCVGHAVEHAGDAVGCDLVEGEFGAFDAFGDVMAGGHWGSWLVVDRRTVTVGGQSDTPPMYRRWDSVRAGVRQSSQ
jgi:hypothetical protein